MTSKIKVKAYLNPCRKIPVDELYKLYTNENTLKVVKQSLDMVSKILDTDPDYFFYDEVLRNADRICTSIMDRYNGSSTFDKHLKTIQGFITRSKTILSIPVTGAPCPYIEARNKIGYKPVVGAKNVPSWSKEVKPYLDDMAVACLKRQGMIIACLYSQGFVFRPGQLFNTSVGKPLEPDANWYDPSTGIMHISNQKNTRKMDVQLSKVTQLMIQHLIGDKWLIPKKNGYKFTSPEYTSIPSTGLGKYTADEYRESFTTWLYKESGYPDSQISEFNKILGHSDNTAETYYLDKDVVVP